MKKFFTIAFFVLLSFFMGFGQSLAGSWGDCVIVKRDQYGTVWFVNRCNKAIEMQYCFTYGGLSSMTCPNKGQTSIGARGKAMVAGIKNSKTAFNIKWQICPYQDYIHNRCRFVW